MLLINHYFADFVHKESIAVSKNGRKERDGEMEQYVDYNWSDIRHSSLFPECWLDFPLACHRITNRRLLTSSVRDKVNLFSE